MKRTSALAPLLILLSFLLPVHSEEGLQIIQPKIGAMPDFSLAAQEMAEKTLGSRDSVYLLKIGCSWYCGGGPSRVTASSCLKASDGFTYDAKNAHDFNLRTSWVEGKDDDGTGEYLEYEFLPGPPVTEVEIHNGMVKSGELWKANSRVKTFRLWINGKPFALLRLKDTRAEQTFAIGSHQAKPGGSLVLRFEIREVYRGSRYRDTAISELEFNGTGVH